MIVRTETMGIKNSRIPANAITVAVIILLIVRNDWVNLLLKPFICLDI